MLSWPTQLFIQLCSERAGHEYTAIPVVVWGQLVMHEEPMQYLFAATVFMFDVLLGLT